MQADTREKGGVACEQCLRGIASTGWDGIDNDY